MQTILLILQLSVCYSTSAANDQSACSVDDATSLIQSSHSVITGTRRESKIEPSPPKDEYFWSQRARDLTSSSYTPYTGPTDLTAMPSWTWSNPRDEEVRHSPLIDSDKNIYVATATRIRKFNADGALLWTWTSSKMAGKMVACPALYDGSIYAVTSGPPGDVAMYSIDMTHGKVNWKTKPSNSLFQHDDAGSVFVYNETMIVPMMENKEDIVGNTVVHAVNATDGSFLWRFTADDGLHNFAPATPRDGTLLFSTSCGGVYRLSFDGKLVWRKGAPSPGHWCSTGGGALGPNGVFYVEYNEAWNSNHGAHIKAYKVSDGSLLWSKTFPPAYGGWQNPAVGKLGANGPLAVVVALGNITAAPSYNEPALPADQELRNAVVALDATTGKHIWRYEEEPWLSNYAAGDMDNWMPRVEKALNYNLTFGLPMKNFRKFADFRKDYLCAPEPQGIPLIAGDGTVYMSSGHSGDLRAIKDKDGNGIIDDTEVSLFSTRRCFSNSPSLAPGMLVAAPCWGPMYVFKS